MLRWLISLLIVANLLTFVTLCGLFGRTPAAGPLSSRYLSRQIHPEQIAVQAMSAPQEQANPASQPDVLWPTSGSTSAQ